MMSITTQSLVYRRGHLIIRGLRSCARLIESLGDRTSASPAFPQLLGPGADLTERLDHAVTSETKRGVRVLLYGVFIIFGVGGLFPLSGAVVAVGSLVSRTSIKKIQHIGGGTVSEIRVHDGMRVDANELLLRLDVTQTRSNLQVLATQMNQVRSRIQRLQAEMDVRDTIVRPVASGVADADLGLEQNVISEAQLFRARGTSRRSQKELLASHVTQLLRQIGGIEAQLKARAAEVDLIAGELRGVQTLYDKRLVPVTRLNSLQREATRLEGEQGQLTSARAEAESKISEAQLQIARIDQEFRTEVTKELREAQDKEAELSERLVVAKDVLAHTEVRAPTSGFVHQLSAHTVGGVVAPGEVIMEIVPDTDELVIEAHLQPRDIVHVAEGQKAVVRLSAFNQRTTPEFNGLVSFVSADVGREKQNGMPEYTVRVSLPGSDVRKLGSLQLVPGMPAEVFLQTGSRTMLGILLKPLIDQLHRTLSDP